MLQYNAMHINIHVKIEKRGRGTYGMNAILKVGLFKISLRDEEAHVSNLPGRSAKPARLLSL